jgi:hypothetical protein
MDGISTKIPGSSVHLGPMYGIKYDEVSDAAGVVAPSSQGMYELHNQGLPLVPDLILYTSGQSAEKKG